ncbi:FGGY family carbohydrate kinase [Spirochaetia bacterium 38H-sp]|uniref:FGGY family carbohydrate kinase n=1 Tax=Rarispira pelagica TaxID=3141764 RepID=A0ABU9U9I9_9SPIR
MAYLLGFDVGSSSVKASLIDAETGRRIASATSPETELDIKAVKPGWAEQDPNTWWEHVKLSSARIAKEHAKRMKEVSAIGISYQMHGLVIVDKTGKTLRDSIIWCDSRAVSYGEKAFKDLGEEFCLREFLNSPGNFTASKLAWVKENEPDVFKNIYRIMLPGDYIAYKMTGRIVTTPSGLSEGILWNAKENRVATEILDYYGIPEDFIPEIVPSFAVQGELTKEAAELLSVPTGIPVSYRAGDQPNNAFSLAVLNPGEIAATAGTSGVVYGVIDSPAYDKRSRVNTFVHVNHSENSRRYGVLMCLNGTGILNRWLKQNTADNRYGNIDYQELNNLAQSVEPGSHGLKVYPYGNGAERTLENRNLGASIVGLNFNIHSRAHLLRAGQEGIAFALAYGMEIMKEMGMPVGVVRAGEANMFLSPVFREVFSNVSDARIELFSTDGSEGAARGAGVGAGIYSDYKQAFVGLEKKKEEEPDYALAKRYKELYEEWKKTLENMLS